MHPYPCALQELSAAASANPAALRSASHAALYGLTQSFTSPADERLHAAFHASATQGPRYQGWAGERVVQLDGSKGRVLLFGSADQGRPRKVRVRVISIQWGRWA